MQNTHRVSCHVTVLCESQDEADDVVDELWNRVGDIADAMGAEVDELWYAGDME